MVPPPPRWPAPARRRALLWLAGWATYGIAIAALRVALSPYPARVSARWIVPATLAAAGTWALLAPLVARVDLAVRRRRLRWNATLLLHGALAVATSLLVSAVRWRVLTAALPGRPVTWWALAIMQLDLDVGTYAAFLWLLRALTTHREFVRRSRRALALETELARARLDFLQRQLRPHFLFNALNAIAQLAREAPATSARMTRHLARLLRSATDAAGATEVTVRDELASLAPYVAIEQLRFGDRITIAQHVDPAAWPALVPKLLLQPVVENAVRHGLQHADGRGEVDIRVAVVGETLRITVENTGTAPSAPTHGRRGIGLRNTRARLAQLYGARHGLALGSDGAGRTTVSIELPWHVEPEREPADLAPAEETLGPPEPTGLTGEHPVTPEPARGTLGDPALRRFGLLWLAVDLLWVAQDVSQQLLYGEHVMLWEAGRIETLSALAWALATPGVLWIARAARVRQGHWRGAVAVHVVSSVLLSLAQVTLVLRLSRLARPVFIAANANQLLVNVMLYAAIVAWTHAREFRDWYRERALASSRLHHELEQTRLQSLALDVRPRFVLRLLDRMARVVVDDPPRAERMAERMADLLRHLLDASGQTSLAMRDQLALVRLGAELHTLATGECVRVVADLDARWLDRHAAPPGLAAALDGRLGAATGAAIVTLTLTAAADDDDALLLVADAPLFAGDVAEDRRRVRVPVLCDVPDPSPPPAGALAAAGVFAVSRPSAT